LQEDAVREARTKQQGLQKEADDLEASKAKLRVMVAKVRQHDLLLPPVFVVVAEAAGLSAAWLSAWLGRPVSNAVAPAEWVAEHQV
jgi:hypothetical protein